MRELSAFLVAPTTSIREAIGVIDRGAAQIALVTEADQRLVGTLTDGAIRRALLRGIDLESPVEEIMFRDFRWLPVTAPESEALALMREQVLHQVPALDDEGRVVRLFLL
mgnify:FL=1